MKVIIISEASFESFRDQLISELTKALIEREARITSGDMTGMSPTPDSSIHFRVHKAFEQLRNG